MGLKIQLEDSNTESGAIIKVIGVGGAGGNAVNRMIESRLRGVDYIVMNTDEQVLRRANAPTRLAIGTSLTNGLGAGANPDVGRKAAEESHDEIKDALAGADMVFVTAGMGGGTGTGAAPVVARIAKENGSLTVAVVTKPFAFEGKARSRQAENGLAELREASDTVIVIPNDKLANFARQRLSAVEAYKMADDVLRRGVQGISDIILVPGLINVDFADVRTVMAERGDALMGIGTGHGDRRALEAAQDAIASPLLEQGSIQGATGLLVNFTSNQDLTIQDIQEAMEVINQAVSEDANIIFGQVVDEGLHDECRITVIATGFNRKAQAVRSVQQTRSTALPLVQQAAYPTSRSSISGQQAPAARAQAFEPQSYVTRRKSVNGGETFEEAVNPRFNEDEYDVPAYIRNQQRG